jgi:hypothetical protein
MEQRTRVPCLPGPVHEPLSEQRLAIGRGNTSARARRPGRRTRLERGLDSGGDEPRGLRVDDDVPAEQNAADDPSGMQGRITRADGGGLGHTRTVGETVLVRLPDTPDLQRLLRQSPGGACPIRGSFGDPVANRSFLDRLECMLWDDFRNGPPVGSEVPAEVLRACSRSKVAERVWFLIRA